LRAENLPEQHEPLDVQPWGCAKGGYGSLHYLRRVAAYLWAGHELPSPGHDMAASDPILSACDAVADPHDAPWPAPICSGRVMPTASAHRSPSPT
jgi:hypothetical protein